MTCPKTAAWPTVVIDPKTRFPVEYRVERLVRSPSFFSSITPSSWSVLCRAETKFTSAHREPTHGVRSHTTQNAQRAGVRLAPSALLELLQISSEFSAGSGRSAMILVWKRPDGSCGSSARSTGCPAQPGSGA